jgi:hypothetical protein
VYTVIPLETIIPLEIILGMEGGRDKAEWWRG